MGISAGIMAGGAIAGGLISGNAAQSAASSEASASEDALAAEENMWNYQNANEKPFIQAGTQALSQVQANMPEYNQPFTKELFQEDPGYQFDLEQGEKAIQNSAAASGHLISSGELGNASTYAQSMASNEFNNAFNRYQTQIQGSYGRLMGLVNTGQNAAAGANTAASNASNAMSSTITGAGNAQAAGTIGTANAISGSITGAANAYGQAGMIQSLLPNGMSNGGGSTSGGFTMGQLNGSSNLQMPAVGSSSVPQYSMSSLLDS